LPQARSLPLAGTVVKFFLHFFAIKETKQRKCPEIAAFILTKSGNRAQNKAGVLLLSLLPAFVSAQL